MIFTVSTLCLFGCHEKSSDTPECLQSSDCASRTDGKTACDVTNQVCVEPQGPKVECTTSAQCEGRTDGKTVCDETNQVCVKPQGNTCGAHEVDSANGCICNHQENYYGNTTDGCKLCTGEGTKLVDNQCICDVGYHVYDGGCEIDTVDHCGDHDTKCHVANAKNSCSGGVCSFTCDDDFHANQNECLSNIVTCDGHSVDVTNDSAHCGECGNLCGVGEICSQGDCIEGIGATYCTGVSINTSDDSVNCGQCGLVCGITSDCISGVCTTKEVGDKVFFGNYFQSNAETKEPIQWRILDIDSVNHKVLLLSEYVLDDQQYHYHDATDITWEECSLRTWLNQDFMTAAFSETEQAIIETTHLDNPDNPFEESIGGNATDDKIFLLSLSEVYGEDSHYSDGTWYFDNNNDREATATWYAVSIGVYAFVYTATDSVRCNTTNYKENQCLAYWRLRSPGYHAYGLGKTSLSARVNTDGSIDTLGSGNSSYGIGIRPALWVNY